MPVITSKIVAEKMLAYLHQKITLFELVNWAETVMMEGDFEKKNYQTLREIVSRIGLADVRAFGLSWEDCREFMNQLGYDIRVEMVVP
jgi:hypothetical protein